MDSKMRKEYAKIIAKAWTDSDFKARLIQDPAAVLKENGILVSDDMAGSFMVPHAPLDLIHEPVTDSRIISCATE